MASKWVMRKGRATTRPPSQRASPCTHNCVSIQRQCNFIASTLGREGHHSWQLWRSGAAAPPCCRNCPLRRVRRGGAGSSGTHHVVLFRYFEAGSGKRFLDQPVGVEVHLPIILVVAVRTNGKHGTCEIEGQYLHVGRR